MPTSQSVTTARTARAALGDAVRQRTRVSQRAMPAPHPAAQAPTLEEDVETAELNEALAAFARANTAKNAATSQEKKAKKALEKGMAKHSVTAHTASVPVADEVLTYKAAIISAETEIMDPQAVLNYLNGDLGEFMKLVSVTKAAVEEHLGKSAAIKVSRTVTKPPALAVSRVKD